MYFWANEHSAIEDVIAKEYLGKDLPDINDITRNMSIYLVNRHPAFLHTKPEQSNVIFYHGFHIAKIPDALPKVYTRTHIHISIYIILSISLSEIQ